jgi:hypothetical protein
MSVRAALLKSRAKVVPVTLSTGDPVYVKGMNGAARALFTQLGKDADGLPMHVIAAIGLCEEDGTMLFDCSTDKGIALAKLELSEVDGIDLQTICLKLYEVSGLTSKAIEEAEKKSEASPSA